MLEQISWEQFLIAIGGGCAAYYGILAVAGKIRLTGHRSRDPIPLPAYPGGNVKTSLRTPQPHTGQPEAGEPSTETTGVPEQTEDPQFTALEGLADEVQVIIAQFCIAPRSKEELLGQLREEIARYPTLRQPAFQRAINNLIIKVTQEECQFTITEAEISQCWPPS